MHWSAYLLHSYPWSESSLIVELFTRERGRVAAVARGAKRPYSQLRTVLLPFQRMGVLLAKPKDEAADITTLRSAEWVGGGPVLAGEALFAGFYLNETLMRLLPRGDADAMLFDAYAATLPALADDAARAHDGLREAALRAFELILSRRLGVLPALDRQGESQHPMALSHCYRLVPELGLQRQAPADAPALPATAWLALHVALEAALRGEPLTALQIACAQAGPPLKPLLRALLHHTLDGAPWRTREVLRSTHALMPPGPRSATISA